MTRRAPYTRVEKRNFKRPSHVEGKGDVLYRGFQCLNTECTHFIFVEDKDIGDDFSIACPVCEFQHTSGEVSIIYDYDLRDKRDNSVYESGTFEILHNDYVTEAKGYKYCIICSTLKPIELFDKHSARATGRQGECNLCKQLYNSIKNQSRLAEQHREASQKRRLYRYYVSLPLLHGESKTASVGSVSRIPATDIEDVIVKSLHEHLIAQKERPSSSRSQVGDRKVLQDSIARIDVHEDHLAIRLKAGDEETSDSIDHRLSIPWRKPPSKRARQILLPQGVPRNEVRPTRIERRARLVSAIARGRRWLDEVVSGSVTDVQQIAARQKCSVRQVNMTISLAFLAPDLVRAAVEGRLPRGIGVERLRDATAEWSQQFEALGLNPQ